MKSQHAELIQLLHISAMIITTSLTLHVLVISVNSQWSLEIAIFIVVYNWCVNHINGAPFIAELFATLLHSHYLHKNSSIELLNSSCVLLIISAFSLFAFNGALCVWKRRNPAPGSTVYPGWFAVILQVIIVVFGNSYMIFSEWFILKENLASRITGLVFILFPAFVCCCFYAILAVGRLREHWRNAARLHAMPSA